MAKCEWCKEKFDKSEAESVFVANTFLLSYDNVKKCLCGDCSVKAIEDLWDGVYFEKCEACGKTFDLILEENEFERHFSPFSGAGLRDYWKDEIVCAECALKVAEKEFEMFDDE